MNTIHCILPFMKARNFVAFLLIVVLQMVTFCSFSQEQAPEFYLPAMPSPTVASLAKYADFPEIDQFGLAPITIPLYEVKLKDFSLPITLSYHAAGVRVSQESTWVGLGFDLTSVGFISRSVRDLADDLEVERNLTTASETLVYQGWLTDPDYFETFPNFSWAQGSNDEQRSAHILSVIDGSPGTATKVDGEPDIFYLNIGNIREKFVFDHQGQVAFLEPDSKLQVTYTLNDYSKGIREFIVVDSEGNKYFFGSFIEDNTATEETTISSEYIGTLTPYSTWLPGSMSFYWRDGGIETRKFRTTWFIRRIFVQSCHQSINFLYEPITEEFDVPLDQYYTKQDGSSDPLNPKPIMHMLWSGLRSIKHQTKTKYLEQIVTPDLAIGFDLSSSRNDLQGARKLDKMSVTSLHTNKVVEECIFEYEVRQSDGEGSGYDRNRLYLTGLTKKGMPAFEFYYSSVPMPDKRSYKQDLWGFPCAKSTSFIPRIYVYPDQTDHLRYSCFPIVGNANFQLLEGSDRTVDPLSVRAGSLERIKLPTGGFLEIELEPNDFYDSDWGEVAGGALRVKEIRKLDEQLQVLHKKEYTYKSGSQSSGRLLNGLGFAIPTTYSIPGSAAIMYYQKSGDPNVWDYFTLRKSSNYFPLVNHDGALVTYENTSIIETGNGKIEKLYYPSPNFKSHATPVQWASPYTRPLSFLNNSTNSYIATGDIASVNLKEYALSEEDEWELVDVYEFVDGSKWTTSGPFSGIEFYFKNLGAYVLLHLTDYNPVHSSIYIMNDESEVQMGQVQKYGTNIFPFPPISDDGTANAGKLHELRYFTEGDLVNPVKQVSYNYTAVGTPVSIFGVVHAPNNVCNTLLTPLPSEKIWINSHNYNTQYFIQSNLHMYVMPKSWAKYHIIANQAHKIETEVTIENSITKTSNLTYNTNFMMKTLGETTSRGSGELKVTSYKYPDDYFYANGANVINKMRDLNILSKPIEKEVTIQQENESRIVSAELQSYKLTTDDLIVLGKVSLYKPTTIDPASMSSTITPAGDFIPDTRYVDDFEFQKYDTRGNLIQYTNRSGIVTSFIWGHNNSLPIAKVENSVLDQQEEILPKQLEAPVMYVSGMQEEFNIVQGHIDIHFMQDVTLNCTVNRGSVDPSIPDDYLNIQLTLFDQQGFVIYSGDFGLTTLNSWTLYDVLPGRYTLKFRYPNDLGPPGNSFNFSTSLNYQIRKIYSNVIYTGFEDDLDGVSGESHTGSRYYVGPFTVLQPKKIGEYFLSYWTKSGSFPWQYVEDDFVVTSTNSQSLIIGSSGDMLDDVRLYPKEANMTSYTYDPLIGITSITDTNNVTTYYQYDEFGRLEDTKDNAQNVVHRYDYHYQDGQ